MDAELADAAPGRPGASNAPHPASHDEGQRRLPVTGHLEELRRRLWVCLGVIGLASAASFAWAGRLIDWLKQPAGTALPTPAFFSPPEAFLAHVKVSVAAGLLFAMPVVLYELWAFVRPALSRREARCGLAFVWWGSALFMAGGAFAYWILLPPSLKFLLSFGAEHVQPVISINRYLSFTAGVILACGLAFQLPLAIFLLAKLDLVSPAALRRRWRHAVVAMAVAAALLTPTTDIAAMLLLVVPMLALYEASIWIAGLAASKERRPWQAE
jgi:sec-independent protein translocase protein TatC